MAALITPSGFHKAYDGAFRQEVDGASLIYSFPNTHVDLSVNENSFIPGMMDSQAFAQNRELGFVIGTITMSGIVKPDRGFDTWLTSAFGPRTGGKMVGFNGTIVPNASGTAQNFVGIYWDRITLSGAFSTSGAGAAIRYSASGYVLDPKNALAMSALAAGVNEGTAGKGLSSFASSSVTNGAASSPVVYDDTTGYRIMLANGFTPDPSVYPGHAADRIVAGYTPGQIAGSLSLTQARNPAQSLPMSGSNNPITLKIPTGDGTETLTLDFSAAYAGNTGSFDPASYNLNAFSYQVFGVNTTNGANSFPFAASLA